MGLYVQRNDSTLYYSEDAATWYTDFDANGLKTTGTPPNGAIDLTATDITSFARTGRPDIGVFEFR